MGPLARLERMAFKETQAHKDLPGQVALLGPMARLDRRVQQETRALLGQTVQLANQEKRDKLVTQDHKVTLDTRDPRALLASTDMTAQQAMLV